MNESHPILDVAAHVCREARFSRVAAVFDLDSTLFDVSPRTQFILRALGTNPEFAVAHPAAAARLKDVEVLPHDYSVREILRRTLATDAAPTPELVAAVRGYWREHFFSSDHLHRDELYPYAADFVRHLRDGGAEIYYLTGRGENRMREGTVRALRAHDFPLEDSKLLMKPSEILSDEGFKADALSKFTHDHIWFFENEPVIIDQVRRVVPRVRIVFVRSAHSGKGTEPVDLPSMSADYGIILRSRR